MADPISLLAIGALVYTGRKMSEPETETRSDPTKYEPPVKPPLLEDMGEEEYPEFEDGPPTWQGKEEVSNFGVVAPQQKSSGAEVLNLRGRFDAGRHNNLSPIEKQLVGPGLGLSPDVPASGGFQQLYLIIPFNVVCYRITTLPVAPGTGTIRREVDSLFRARSDTIDRKRRRISPKGSRPFSARVRASTGELRDKSTRRANASRTAPPRGFARTVSTSLPLVASFQPRASPSCRLDSSPTITVNSDLTINRNPVFLISTALT